jgi:hypothetical protein
MMIAVRQAPRWAIEPACPSREPSSSKGRLIIVSVPVMRSPPVRLSTALRKVRVGDIDQQAGEQGLLEIFEGGVRRHFGEGMGTAEIELVGLIPGTLTQPKVGKRFRAGFINRFRLN